MSYAGPASHAKRMPDGTPKQTANGGSRRSELNPPTRNSSQATDRSGSVLFGAGIALGVVVGATIALLFAPQAGSDTRQSLARRGRRLNRRSHDAWDDLREEFRHALKQRRLAGLRSRHRADEEAHLE